MKLWWNVSLPSRERCVKLNWNSKYGRQKFSPYQTIRPVGITKSSSTITKPRARSSVWTSTTVDSSTATTQKSVDRAKPKSDPELQLPQEPVGYLESLARDREARVDRWQWVGVQSVTQRVQKFTYLWLMARGRRQFSSSCAHKSIRCGLAQSY